ncbi:hypothetical protein CEXT_505391 [Caerostris extrusa]|uniref:Uncharacterized protein n=1 Tax=Caerostris extrusa TaxID=172846 RepID=A0AAV4UCY6_CAEEX|nr:hypothetical protein CEXT_505391 [Caerostris extrusa]
MTPLSMQIRRAGNAVLESTHVTSFSKFLQPMPPSCVLRKLSSDGMQMERLGNGRSSHSSFTLIGEGFYLFIYSTFFFSRSTFKRLRLARVKGLKWIYKDILSFMGPHTFNEYVWYRFKLLLFAFLSTFSLPILWPFYFVF